MGPLLRRHRHFCTRNFSLWTIPTAVTFNDQELSTRLANTTRFARLVHEAICTSTQDLAEADLQPGPTIYWADHQTSGRGRQQRVWDDAGDSDLTLTFRFHLPLQTPMALPACVPLCVLQAVEPMVGKELGLKWPNDVFCDGKKLAGVLIDSDGHGSYAIGIGINVNRTHFPRELDGRATSLAIACGHTFDRRLVLVALAQSLETTLVALANNQLRTLEQQFAARLGLTARNVQVVAGSLHTGTLVSFDFERLTLDGGRSVPIGLVQSIRAI